MPKITIDLPADTNEKLKAKAKEDYRSLTNYITVALINLANGTLLTSIQSQSQSLNLEQLQEQGISQIKFTSSARTLSPEEEQLHQAKLQQQLSHLKQQKIKFLKQKSEEILGHILPYLENNDQKTIDWVLNQYPTDEDIVKYLQNVKIEDEMYANNEYEEEPEPEPQNETYQKIKKYFKKHLEPYELDDLLEHARINDIEYVKEYYVLSIYDALDIPHSYEWSHNQWLELFQDLTDIK